MFWGGLQTWWTNISLIHPFPKITHTRTADAKYNGNGFVGYDPDLDVVIISFAGTDTGSTKNWIDDLDGELTHYPWAGEEEGCGHCKVRAYVRGGRGMNGFWCLGMGV